MVAQQFIPKTFSLLFVHSLIYQLFHPLNKRRLLILCYHRIIKPNIRQTINNPGNCVGENQFNQQMNFLKRQYNPISQDQLLKFIFNNEPLPEFPILITFDDGYKDNFTNAYPILKKYSIPAVLFLTTGYINKQTMPCDDYIAIAIEKTEAQKSVLIDNEVLFLRTPEEKRRAIKRLWEISNSLSKKRHTKERKAFFEKLLNSLNVDVTSIDNLFLNWEDIKRLDEDGIAFGSHTVSHTILSQMSEDEMCNEIIQSKQEIEQHLGKNVVSFAYPNGKRGNYNQKCIDILKNNGFAYAVTTELGTNSLKKISNPFELRRICVSYNDNLNMFITKLNAWAAMPHLQKLLS